MLGIDPGQRRGQVIAQRQPVFVLFQPGKHALIGAVDIGQEFAQGFDRLHRRAFQRLKAIAMVNRGDLLQHIFADRDLVAEIIAKALGRQRLGAGCLFGFLVSGHGVFPLGMSGQAFTQRRGRGQGKRRHPAGEKAGLAGKEALMRRRVLVEWAFVL